MPNGIRYAPTARDMFAEANTICPSGVIVEIKKALRKKSATSFFDS